jgi:predicted DNA-binding protein
MVYITIAVNVKPILYRADPDAVPRAQESVGVISQINPLLLREAFGFFSLDVSIVYTLYHIWRWYMSKQMIIRIDPVLKSRVENYARAEGKNVSMVVRELLEDYIVDRDISGYIDDLWNRIGIKIREQDISADDIDAIIKQTRTQK